MTNEEKLYQVFPDGISPFSKVWLSEEYQEPQSFKWCTDCKEYDQEKHCCHRYSKVIRDTVEEMKQEQEPILDKYQAEIDHLHKYIAKLETQITEDSFINKPCVSEKTCEHDKNTVLDKIRAEIIELWQNEPCAIEGGCLDEILEILDKYKADRSVEDGND